MALLADLRHFHQRLSHLHSGADGKGGHIDSRSGDILSEVSRPYVEALGHHLLDGFPRQQAHLTMPGPRMPIADDPVLLFQKNFGHRLLPLSFARTHIDGDNRPRRKRSRDSRRNIVLVRTDVVFLAARLLQQADVPDHHATVHGFTHVVYGHSSHSGSG
jgi:hypothetical protein